MSDELRTSLIITTYNWPEALRVVLDSVVKQRKSPDEIIIADDGSEEETARAVDDVLGFSNIEWKHVRHADHGVRQSRIKNLAVRHSCGTYLIFVDHDVILHPRFVEDHVGMACKGSFLQGKRVLLSNRHTHRVVGTGTFNLPDPWTKGIRNRKNSIRWPLLGNLLSKRKRFESSLRGCNLSMFRDDFIRVDGFDETFDGSWGREDSDICYRLFHAGVQIRVLWFLALQYHLHHAVTANWDRKRLDAELDGNLKEKRVKAVKGFSRLSSEGEIIAASGDFLS